MKPLIVEMLPELHGEPGGWLIFGPLEGSGVDPCSTLQQQGGLFRVRALQLDQVGLAVDVIYLVDTKAFDLAAELGQDEPDVKPGESGLHIAPLWSCC